MAAGKINRFKRVGPSMRKKLVAGNWKMNGDRAGNRALLDGVVSALGGVSRGDGGARCAVCVPFPYLFQAQELLQGTPVTWGAQDVCQFDNGAYTGEVSARMLVDAGCTYVIVGHSERRGVFGETDDVVARKLTAALDAGLTPILCVGETLAERDAELTHTVVARQLDAALAVVGMDGISRSVIAYEPVWAIGTGRTARPEQAQAVHAFVRERLAQQDADVAAWTTMLYGGSVKAANAAELFAMPDIDGGLIGGASLSIDEFVAICRAPQAVAAT
ncbi:MAG TPA: triose-phosphate isomerase [Burkholderiales bacterium]|nr:triose-phosphate isomerase [Burkholderiales bacterium]